MKQIPFLYFFFLCYSILFSQAQTPDSLNTGLKSSYFAYEELPVDSLNQELTFISAKQQGYKNMENYRFLKDSLNTTGFIMRGVRLNNGGLGLNSALNLKMAGTIYGEHKLNLVIADEDLEYSEEGTTTDVSEIDKLFLEATHPDYTFTGGNLDHVFAQNTSYLKFQERVSGLSFNLHKEKYKHEEGVTGAVTRNQREKFTITLKEGIFGPYELTSNETIIKENFAVYYQGQELGKQLYSFDFDYNNLTLSPEFNFNDQDKLEIYASLNDRPMQTTILETAARLKSTKDFKISYNYLQLREKNQTELAKETLLKARRSKGNQKANFLILSSLVKNDDQKGNYDKGEFLFFDEVMNDSLFLLTYNPAGEGQYDATFESVANGGLYSYDLDENGNKYFYYDEKGSYMPYVKYFIPVTNHYQELNLSYKNRNEEGFFLRQNTAVQSRDLNNLSSGSKNLNGLAGKLNLGYNFKINENTIQLENSLEYKAKEFSVLGDKSKVATLENSAYTNLEDSLDFYKYSTNASWFTENYGFSNLNYNYKSYENDYQEQEVNLSLLRKILNKDTLATFFQYQKLENSSKLDFYQFHNKKADFSYKYWYKDIFRLTPKYSFSSYKENAVQTKGLRSNNYSLNESFFFKNFLISNRSVFEARDNISGSGFSEESNLYSNNIEVGTRRAGRLSLYSGWQVNYREFKKTFKDSGNVKNDLIYLKSRFSPLERLSMELDYDFRKYESASYIRKFYKVSNGEYGNYEKIGDIFVPSENGDYKLLVEKTGALKPQSKVESRFGYYFKEKPEYHEDIRFYLSRLSFYGSFSIKEESRSEDITDLILLNYHNFQNDSTTYGVLSQNHTIKLSLTENRYLLFNYTGEDLLENRYLNFAEEERKRKYSISYGENASQEKFGYKLSTSLVSKDKDFSSLGITAFKKKEKRFSLELTKNINLLNTFLKSRFGSVKAVNTTAYALLQEMKSSSEGEIFNNLTEFFFYSKLFGFLQLSFDYNYFTYSSKELSSSYLYEFAGFLQEGNNIETNLALNYKLAENTFLILSFYLRKNGELESDRQGKVEVKLEF